MDKIVSLTKRRGEVVLRTVMQEVAEQEGREISQMAQFLPEPGPSEMALHRFAKQLDAYFLRHQAAAHRRKGPRPPLPS